MFKNKKYVGIISLFKLLTNQPNYPRKRFALALERLAIRARGLNASFIGLDGPGSFLLLANSNWSNLHHIKHLSPNSSFNLEFPPTTSDCFLEFRLVDNPFIRPANGLLCPLGELGLPYIGIRCL